MKLDEALDRTIGDGPEHRPVEDRITAGRRVVRRRRTLGSGVAALALVAVAGAGWALADGPGSAQSRDPGFSDQPSASSTDDLIGIPPSPGKDVSTAETLGADAEVTLDDSCQPVPSGNVVIESSVDDVFGDADNGSGVQCAVAVVYLGKDDTTWAVLARTDDTDATRQLARTPANQVRDGISVERWEAEESLRWYPQLVSFGDTGQKLEPADGVTILTQQTDLQGFSDSFALPDERTAAALVERGPFRWFVLARDVKGGPDFIPSVPRGPNEILEQFLDEARGHYLSGEGLL